MEHGEKMENKEGYSLSKTVEQKVAWLEPNLPPASYAKELFRFDITVAEALEVMAGLTGCGYIYQELVIREMIKLKEKELS